MMMMQNIHDNRGSHEAKDAKSNRKPVCFYDLSSASVKKSGARLKEDLGQNASIISREERESCRVIEYGGSLSAFARAQMCVRSHARREGEREREREREEVEIMFVELIALCQFITVERPDKPFLNEAKTKIVFRPFQSKAYQKKTGHTASNRLLKWLKRGTLKGIACKNG